MAKRVGAEVEPGVAIFLITLTAKAFRLSEKERQKHRDEITKYVQDNGGSCQLYQTPGGIYDFVSVVTGVSDIKKLFDLVEHIESEGTVKALLLLGSRRFHKG